MRRLLLYIIGTVVLLSACMRSSDFSKDEPFSAMYSFDEAAGPAPTTRGGRANLADGRTGRETGNTCVS
ncbi:MAG: hypothetical protein IJS35_00565 [Firmicutes bacterium]|nr:hypothetical protein [Bacillota bacterium]